MKKIRIFTHEFNQAYIRSDDELTRQILLLRKTNDLGDFGLTQKDILELLRPIYGKTDAGDYWGVTVDRPAKG